MKRLSRLARVATVLAVAVVGLTTLTAGPPAALADCPVADVDCNSSDEDPPNISHKADLQVSQVTVTYYKTEHYPGGRFHYFRVSYRVSNIGNKATGPSVSKLFSMGKQNWEQRHQINEPSINAPGSVLHTVDDLRYYIVTPYSGTDDRCIRVKVVADAFGSVTESYEGNNVAIAQGCLPYWIR